MVKSITSILLYSILAACQGAKDRFQAASRGALGTLILAALFERKRVIRAAQGVRFGLRKRGVWDSNTIWAWISMR